MRGGLLVANNKLFRGLSPPIKAKIAALCSPTRLRNGQILFQKGDDGDALFAVVAGKLKICTQGPDGREVILNVLSGGDVFGEIALLDGRPRTADAVALTDCQLWRLPRPSFLELLAQEAELATHMISLLCQRIRWQSAFIEDTAFLQSPARLAKRLLILSEAHQGEREAIRISQSDLASLVGASRETVNRFLGDWQRLGWIQLRRNAITVLDPLGLQELIALSESDNNERPSLAY